ncbi:hypothetical protein ABT294_22065 [Nonomuraea sp. NPDC000554]|uniref:hypothetical protein n=1 Tax=Nonomuraea sp. NPDC000554 TaxID=3154259 RepID=UPI0033341A17
MATRDETGAADGVRRSSYAFERITMEEQAALTALAEAVQLRGLAVARARTKHGATLLVRNTESTLTAAVACRQREDGLGLWFVWAEWDEVMLPVAAVPEAADRVAHVLAPASVRA